MKNIIKIFIASTILVSGLAACQQFDDVAKIEQITQLESTVSLSLDLGDAPTPTQFNVKFTNYSDRFVINKVITPNGNIVVDGIIPGVYTITISAEMAADGFTYNYSGSLVNQKIVADNGSFTVKVQASKSGALVFKEVFYCGSRTPTGGSYFRDQFYEIYNNSDNAVNVRGLAIALLNPNTATANLPVWEGADAANFVYATAIWQVPDDKDYTVNPGESIIIAQMADDHKKANLNPSSPVNLLSAEFETYVNTTSVISDNQAINMYMAFLPVKSPQWLTTVFGGVFVIYFPTDVINANNYVTSVGSATKCYKIPIVDVIDALELVGNSNQMNLKRMPTTLDAGAATVGGTYLTKSVARKVKETKNGRVILYDTNNSTNDFEVMDIPTIRRYGAVAPSWNTWK